MRMNNIFFGWKNGLTNWFSEKTVFYSVLLFNILLLLTVRYYPSMDGPSHLYNANLITHLLKGDSDFISAYFALNKLPIPNWTSFVILSAFNSFLPAWIAEKLLLLFYFIGLSFSFRALVKQLCPENSGLSIIIFPFSYSFLFHLGFYNYSLSFIFLFISITYLVKFKDEYSLRKYLILLFTITLAYFSAILSFIFLGISLGLFEVAFSIRLYSIGLSFRETCKKLIGRLLLLLAVSLPSLIFSLIFITSTGFSAAHDRNAIGELVKWLNDVRCIIVYDYEGEAKLTAQFLHILIAIIAVSLYLRFSRKDDYSLLQKFRKSDVFIAPMFIALVCFFTIPNGAHAGMMSDRFCLLAYMFFIIWVVCQPLKGRIVSVLIALIVILHVGLMFKRQNGTIRSLDKDATCIGNTSKYIGENSIVLPVNMSENWIEPHFSNYLGVDKPMVILENYEASMGWFPVLWNTKRLPRIMLGQHESFEGLHWMSNTASPMIKQIDYVFLFGSTAKINDPNWVELRETLKQYYTLAFSSDNGYVLLYKLK